MSDLNVTTGSADSGAMATGYKNIPITPRVQQLKLPETLLKDITGYYTEQIRSAIAARSEMEQRWQEWDRQWEAVPRGKMKDFPWPGASNLELPMAAIVGMTIYSRLLNTLFAGKPFWAIKTELKAIYDDVKRLEEFVQAVGEPELHLFDVVSSVLMTTVRMGTGFMKTGYDRRRDRFLTYDDTGNVVEREYTVYDGPCLEPVAIENLFVPRFNIESVHDQPWIAERHVFTTGQARELQKRLGLDADVADESTPGRSQQHQRDDARDDIEGVAQNISGQASYPIDWYEVWGRYDINGDGREEEIVVFQDLNSAKPLGVYAMWYFDRKRPYTKFVYERREHRFYGVGVGGMLERLQDSISTIHNQRIDNATLANTRLWKARRSTGLKPGEAVWPGRVITMNDPKNDLIGEQMGDIYASAVNNESILRDYVERRSAVSEFTMGRESSVMGSRATATSTLAIMQEGNKRFDLAMKETRGALNEVGTKVVARYHQFKPTGKLYYIVGDKGDAVQRVLNFPPNFITDLVTVSVAASTQMVNREIEKQNRITIWGLMEKFYQRMFDMMQMLATPGMPPPMVELASTAAAAAQKLALQILEDFDVKNPESYLPTAERIAGLMASTDSMAQQMGAMAGPAGPGGGMPPPGGMNGNNGVGGGISGPPIPSGIPPGVGGANSVQ